jgi:serine/threonine protein kinase
MMAELQPGDPELIGQYRLLGRLGSGGMGQVFLARSPGGRLIAIKVIHPQFALDDQFRERFRREVAAARRVSGLFTAPVVDADLSGSVPWLATAYVAGPSLAKAVTEQGPLPAKTLPFLFAGLAEGLEAIHGAGLVHRDLKPSNVLLASDGPRVIDFGVSIAREASDTLTGPGMVIGSPGFLSPEQAMGMPVGTASDVFSLGSVVVFAATGQSPFGTGAAPALLYRVVSQEPDLAGLPDNIASLVRRCLAKEPGERPTIRELLAELGGVAAPPDWQLFTRQPDVGIVTPQGMPEVQERIQPAPAVPVSPASPTVTMPAFPSTQQPDAAAPIAPAPAVEAPDFATGSSPVVFPTGPWTTFIPGPVVNPDSIMTRAEFARALQALCQHANLAVRDVAKTARLSVSTVNAYFRGDRIPASMGALGFILVACDIADERQWEAWERAFRRVRVLPQDHQTSQTRRRAKPAEPPGPDQPDLLMSIYIPNERLYAAEHRRVLTLFRDWLAKTRKHGIRQSERSTSRGAMFEYYADGSVSLPELKAEIDVFSYFLNKCADSPAAALNVLSETEIGPAAATELVTQFGKEVRRVEVDARHARERGMLSLKQTLENSLLETGVDLRAVPGAQLDAVLEELVPYPNIAAPLPALTGPPVVHLPPNASVTFHQNIYSAVEQTIIEHVQGTVNLGARAKEILALIDRFAAQPDVPALTTAVHELEDPDAPADSRRTAKAKLKKFLADLSGKAGDAALSILGKYLESKLGI